MTVYTGTATDFKDLLNKVRGHAVSSGWTVKSYTTTGSAPRTDALYLQGPGYGTGYECYVGIRTYEDSTNSHYSLEVRGFTNYQTGLTWDTQPGPSPSVYTNLWNTSIPYWAYISDRRILVVAKCSNTYHSFYAGFFNPFASPTQYPYPMYIAGDASEPLPFGDLSYHSRAPAFPGYQGAYLREPGGLWRQVTVYNDNSLFDFQDKSATTYTTWPYLAAGSSSSYDDDGSGYGAPNIAIAPLPGGSGETLFLTNVLLTGCSDDMGVFGALEGLYWLPGNLMSVEQALTKGSDTYRVFIGLSRSVEVPSQFYAVLEV